MVSANFVIPYPPGFPIMVPGQVIEADTIGFMRKLDVKEIHGYNATRGLKLIKLSAIGQQHPASGGSKAQAAAVRPNARRHVQVKIMQPDHRRGRGNPSPRQSQSEDNMFHDRLVLRHAETVSGNRDFPDARSRLLLRQVHVQGHRPRIGHRHAARRRADRPDRYHDRAASEGDRVPDVPVRRRLRRRTAVRARRRQGWPAAGGLLGGPVRVQPAGLRRDREDRRLRSRLRGRPLLGLADDFRRDGPFDRRDQPPRHGTRRKPRPCSTRCRSPMP